MHTFVVWSQQVVQQEQLKNGVFPFSDPQSIAKISGIPVKSYSL
jgi:predicted ATPase